MDSSQKKPSSKLTRAIAASMVASARFERATPSFGGKYSNPLSYEAIAESLPFVGNLVKRGRSLFGEG